MRYLLALLLLTSCTVGVLPTPEPTITLPPTATPWLTNTPSATPAATATLTAVNISSTTEATPTPEFTFSTCVPGSYAVAWWSDFTVYELPNLTGETITLDESNMLGYYPYQGQWLPITAVLLIEKDATFGTWYVVTGEGTPVYGWISPDVLTQDCQY